MYISFVCEIIKVMATVVGNFAAKPAVDDNVKNFFFDRITSSSVLPRVNTDPITFIVPSIEGKRHTHNPILQYIVC